MGQKQVQIQKGRQRKGNGSSLPDLPANAKIWRTPSYDEIKARRAAEKS